MDEIRNAISDAIHEMETEAVEQENGGEGGEGQRKACTERDIKGIGDARRQTD